MTRWVDETLHADRHIKLTAGKVPFDSERAHPRLVLLANETFG